MMADERQLTEVIKIGTKCHSGVLPNNYIKRKVTMESPGQERTAKYCKGPELCCRTVWSGEFSKAQFLYSMFLFIIYNNVFDSVIGEHVVQYYRVECIGSKLNFRASWPSTDKP